MCGITGKCDFKNKVDYELISRMTDTLIHRCPDDKGIWVKDNFGFGMRRLSIIDIKGGHQPIINYNENLVIIFNGEIYNYLELKQHLISKGYKFKTNSDTETILYLYQEYNDEAFNKLNGMFAIAIWDIDKEELTLVRDRLGIKPLYYYQGNDQLIFGSEIKSILEDNSIVREIDEIGMSYYFNFMYIPNPLSAFKNINKLKPGHILKLKDKKILLKKFWDFNPSDIIDVNSKEDLKIEFLELFEDSVKKRMLSEVPVGGFLSGGIDSSAIVAMMAKNSSHRVRTYSIGFNDKY